MSNALLKEQIAASRCRPGERPAPYAASPLYAPRWRWHVRPVAVWDVPLPMDILGVFPPPMSIDRFTREGLPAVLRQQSPAAVLAAVAAADGFLPPDLRLAVPAQPLPFRVALFGPGADDVLRFVRRLFRRLPEDRILHAFAVRGRCGPQEAALPPGTWPVLCGPQPPLPAPGGAPAGLPDRLGSLRVPSGGLIIEGDGYPFGGLPPSPLIAIEARLLSAALPALHDRLYALLMTLWGISGGIFSYDGQGSPETPPAGALADAAQSLVGWVFGDAVAFYARVRPPKRTPALRAAAAILKNHPRTVAKTTCGVSGVTDDDLCRLADIGWLEYDQGPGQFDYGPPSTGRWKVPEELRALPRLELSGLGRPTTPVAVEFRIPVP